MLGRTHRFHGYGSLRFVYKNGQSVRGSLMSLRHCPNPRRTNYRLAVVVSRKVHKSAVVRNRIRRRVYETCRQQLAGVAHSQDVVITVFHESVATMPAPELEEHVSDLLQRAKLTGLLKHQTHDIIETKEN